MIPEQAEIAIRAAQTDDIPALHALIESAYRGDAARAGWTHEADLLGGQRIDLEGLADILADPDQYLLIATRADGTVRRSLYWEMTREEWQALHGAGVDRS